MLLQPVPPAAGAFGVGSMIAIGIVVIIAAAAILLARTVFRTDRTKGGPSKLEDRLQRFMDDPGSIDPKSEPSDRPISPRSPDKPGTASSRREQ